MANYYVNKNAQSNGDHDDHRPDGYPPCRTPAAGHGQHALEWHQCQRKSDAGRARAGVQRERVLQIAP